MLQTRPEPTERRERTVRYLVYVMSFDQLTRDLGSRISLARVSWPLTIGRANQEGEVHLDGSRLEIPDPFMSGEHASMDKKGTALVISDAGSRNGTRVNGAAVDEHRLADGDLIEVGHSMLCYREVSEVLVEALDRQGDRPCLGPTRTLCGEMAALGNALERIGPSSEPVLILADTGSGKEVAAAAVHRISGRRGEFRAVDCGAVPENLFESTFFGHKKGAFTSAEADRTGEIELAHGGTLFLDEVGNMTAAAQAKLLRVIETGTLTPVGGTKPTRVDVRWVAATNRDLFGDDDFREDLLRRLAGYVARIPPLRQRREDLGILCAHLLTDAGAAKASITPAAARTLFCGDFGGNIRELRAALRSASLLAGDQPIDSAHLPVVPNAPGPPHKKPAAPRKGRSSADREAIEAALRETGGNVVRTAETLGTHARQVYRWIERFGIELDQYRD